MRIVKMEGSADCGAACLAMALGLRKSSDVYPILGYDPNIVNPQGVSDVEAISVLTLFGRTTQYVHPRESSSASWGASMEELEMRVHLPTRKKIQARLGSMLTGCALVGVPSLNDPGQLHFVFCFKGEIYDPSNAKVYHGSANSLPVDTVIFIKESPSDAL